MHAIYIAVHTNKRSIICRPRALTLLTLRTQSFSNTHGSSLTSLANSKYVTFLLHRPLPIKPKGLTITYTWHFVIIAVGASCQVNQGCEHGWTARRKKINSEGEANRHTTKQNKTIDSRSLTHTIIELYNTRTI